MAAKANKKKIETAKISPFKTKEALDLDVENSLSAQQKITKTNRINKL